MTSRDAAGRPSEASGDSAPRDDLQTFTVTLPRNFTGRVTLIIDADPEDEPLPPTRAE